MGALLSKYRLAFILYGILLTFGIILVVTVPKLELHVFMNSSHGRGQDAFFKIITWLGDGWFAVVFSLAFIFIRFRLFFMLIVSYAVSGLLAQFLKRVVFPGALRPGAYLEQMESLEIVAGVGLHHTLSFPSGHTSTAFAVLLLAGFISGRRGLLFTGMVAAWCVALSRVYLSQHFLIDVLAGSVLGTVSALFFYWYFQGLKPVWLGLPVQGLFKSRK